MDASRKHLAQALWKLSEVVFTDWTGYMTRIAQNYGLTMGELNTLYELSVAGTLNVSGIAERSGLSKAATSQMIERMVQDGLLERRESPHSRREKHISLTEKAKEINRQFDQAVLEEMVKVLEAVPEAKIKTLSKALEAVLQHLPQKI